MHPDAKLNFDRAAQALGLDPATRDLAWRRMMDIGLTPDDPTVVYLAVGGLLEQAAKTIPEAINAVPERVERAAARAVGAVAQAATARVEAAHAALAERTGAAVAEAAPLAQSTRMRRPRLVTSPSWSAPVHARSASGRPRSSWPAASCAAARATGSGAGTRSAWMPSGRA